MFDPTLPLENTEIDAVQMRSQLNGLKALIDAISSITSAQVDAVATVNPGDPATVNLVVVGTELHFSFGIPKGLDGVSSLPVTSFVVDTVTTLNPGDAATASAMFNGASVLLNFGIPRGADGASGANGTDGSQGPQGPQGLPGEVTTAALVTAINDTSKVSNAVATLGLMVSDPPTQTELQLTINKLDELIAALRRV